jgi:hypothetical protein
VKHVPETGKPPSSVKAASIVYLLDTSALLSFIEDEEGADRVAQALKQKETILAMFGIGRLRRSMKPG